MSRLLYLDYLRGIAVILVLLTHMNEFISGTVISDLLSVGARGVQLFFIVSGFTIAYIYHDKINDFNSLVNFLIKRFFRIAPLFYFSLFLYIVIKVVLIGSLISIENVLLTSSFLNGFTFEYINSILGVEWSIAIEMQFYLFYALVSYIGLKCDLKLLSLFFIISISGFSYGYLFDEEFKNNIYLSPMFQFYNFYLGIMVYLLGYKLKKFQYNSHIIIACFIFIFLLPFIINSVVIQTYISSIIFCVILLHVKDVKYLFCRGSLSTIGVYSFSIYLNHYLFVLISRYLDLKGFEAVALILVGTFILSLATYNMIELKFIKVGAMLTNRYLVRNL